ncbi:hypothetical protein AAFF_G00242150 [Aldrovandia affinis]|uniref:Uncharacterized protein n=1 Tax=Aldrovandia affinis TaxID=143900 RepID=A0AAD7SUR8_9TELE|nr:hypothetical protein AAFF_G00242150 [Aldrovandia affinis]
MPQEGHLPPEQLALLGIQPKPSLVNRSEHVVEVSESMLEAAGMMAGAAHGLLEDSMTPAVAISLTFSSAPSRFASDNR